MKNNFLEPFKSVVEKLISLEKYPEYQSAFLFGSLARGEQEENSDVDAIVITKKGFNCKNISQPKVSGVKIDITFQSLQQFKKQTQEEIKKGTRIPMICESAILFDKNGKLTKYKSQLRNIKHRGVKKDGYRMLRFLIHHADNKAKRNIKTDPYTAHLALNINLNEIMTFHYRLNKKWWVSNKRMLKDLDKWDSGLAKTLKKFVTELDINKKYAIWEEIADHISIPLGGRFKLTETNCICDTCKKNLSRLN